MRFARRTTLLVLGLAGALAAAPATAAPTLELTLDPGRSTISFTLGATIHTVHGTARMTAGRATLAPASGEMGGEIVVDAASTDTDNDGRDEKMHSKVLVVETHPRIVLRPERLEGAMPDAGEADVVLVASLELVGASHQLEIPAHVARQDDEIAIHASFEVPYVEWGLKDPSVFLLRVEKQVTVEIETVATVTTLEPMATGDDTAAITE